MRAPKPRRFRELLGAKTQRLMVDVVVADFGSSTDCCGSYANSYTPTLVMGLSYTSE